MIRENMKSQLNTNLLGIGEALEEPVEITGGLLHKMYRVKIQSVRKRLPHFSAKRFRQ